MRPRFIKAYPAPGNGSPDERIQLFITPEWVSETWNSVYLPIDQSLPKQQLFENILMVAQPDSQLQMARWDPPHLQILGCVSSQLENLVREVQTLIKGQEGNLQPVELWMFTTYVDHRHFINLGGEILEDASTVDCRGTSNSPQPLFTLHLDQDCWLL